MSAKKEYEKTADRRRRWLYDLLPQMTEDQQKIDRAKTLIGMIERSSRYEAYKEGYEAAMDNLMDGYMNKYEADAATKK